MEKTNTVYFCGIDDWSRFVFKRNTQAGGARYYCVVEELAEIKKREDGSLIEGTYGYNLDRVIERVNAGLVQIHVKSPPYDFEGEPDFAVGNLTLGTRGAVSR